jgi:hypothetical protein
MIAIGFDNDTSQWLPSGSIGHRTAYCLEILRHGYTHGQQPATS